MNFRVHVAASDKENYRILLYAAVFVFLDLTLCSQGLAILASHAGVFRGARFSSEKRAPLKTPAWEAIAV